MRHVMRTKKEKMWCHWCIHAACTGLCLAWERALLSVCVYGCVCVVSCAWVGATISCVWRIRACEKEKKKTRKTRLADTYRARRV